MRTFLKTFLLLLVIQCLQAQSTPLLNEPALPRFQSTLTIPQGMRLESTGVTNRSFPMELTDSFQMALQVLRDSLDAKGLSATVLADNGDVWNGAVGDSHAGVPMTPDMYLGMGSLSKSITAACLLKLQEEGVVNLDNPISDYLPAFPNIISTITVRQLLNNTSGAFDFLQHPAILDSMQANTNRVWTPIEILNNFVNSAYFVPGTDWRYSNTNYLLAGLVIEQVSGLPYHEAVQSKILQPAGLGDIFLNPYETTTGDIAHVWLFNTLFQIKIDLDALNKTPISIYSAAWAAGAYFSKPEQVANWLSALMKGEVLSPTSLTQMQGFVPANDIEYGLGLMKISNGTQYYVGHQGFILYSSLCFFDPQLNLTIAIQSNDATATDLSAFLGKAHALYSQLLAQNNIETVVGNAFPNPASDRIELQIPSSLKSHYQYQVLDILGRSLAVKKISQHASSIVLDISAYEKGSYFVTLNDGNMRVTYRFITY